MLRTMMRMNRPAGRAVATTRTHRFFTSTTTNPSTAKGLVEQEAAPKFHEGPIVFGIVFGSALAFNYYIVQKWAPSLHKEELEKRIHVVDPAQGEAHLKSARHH